jgi:GT2 family glycosyltransferase
MRQALRLRPVNVDLRAVVLSYGPGRLYRAVLDSLSREGLDRSRVLIVHNPSTRDEPAPVEEGVEVLRSSHNLGYATAMNHGVRRQIEQGCDWVLTLTHDADLRPGALGRLTEAAARGRHGALGPVLMLGDTSTVFSSGGRTNRFGGVSHRRALPAGGDDLADCNWIDGGTMLLRVAALERAGLFEERFWSYFEDAELCLRISRAGFGVAVVPAAVANQEPGMTKRLGPWAYLMTRNGIAYAGRFAGARGVVPTTGRALWDACFEATRALARALHLRPGDPVERWAVAVGKLRGIAAVSRGNWGPPPAGLPGGGDIGNVDPPPGAPDGG